MNTDANAIIHHLGGTTAVARMIEAPVSTVHSWKSIGIPSSRLAHLKLVAKAARNPIPDDLTPLIAAWEADRPTEARDAA